MKHFLASLVFFLFANTAFAVPMLNVQGGQLMGASGVDVDGTLYDVSFQDGSCVSLFDGCDSVNDFVFKTEASALSASAALLNRVFLNGAEGLFDSMPAQTSRCYDTNVCVVLTPFSPMQIMKSTETLAAVAFNRSNSLGSVDDFFVGSNPADRDFSTVSAATWAVWSEHVVPATPAAAPGSFALLALGLAGLGISKKRTKQ